MWKVFKYGVFSGPNVGNKDKKKLRIWTLFTQWFFFQKIAETLFLNIKFLISFTFYP